MFEFKELLKNENAFCGQNFYILNLPINTNIYIIADIHGCYKTFKSLLNSISFSKDDYLFLLGDYISRGPKSKETIDLIIDLILNDYKIFPLRGNHEHRLILKHKKTYSIEELSIPNQYKNTDFLTIDNKIRCEYLSFFSNLPYYYEIGDYILVHAGLNFETTNYMLDFDSMLWQNTITISNNFYKKIIRGHIPYTLEQIKNSLYSQIINLDNGCVYKSRKENGNLVCLELTTKNLIIQKNID